MSNQIREKNLINHFLFINVLRFLIVDVGQETVVWLESFVCPPHSIDWNFSLSDGEIANFSWFGENAKCFWHCQSWQTEHCRRKSAEFEL